MTNFRGRAAHSVDSAFLLYKVNLVLLIPNPGQCLPFTFGRGMAADKTIKTVIDFRQNCLKPVPANFHTCWCNIHRLSQS